ncbi:MAG: hypothetical protein Q4G45_11120 [Actinomycetia bacterium]|nr:hypothetical protein [Actinomycetes bacterium]
MEPTDDGWERIAAESELRPPHGPVTGVPGLVADLEPQQVETEPASPPIQADQVPDPPPTPLAEPPGPDQPIQQVPYRAEPEPVDTVPVIKDTPLETPLPVTEEPPLLITEVPEIAPGPQPAPQPALPEQGAGARRTPWWRLMLGRGSGRPGHSA